MDDQMAESELCERYAKLYPGAITDILDEIGYEDQTLSQEIGPIEDGMTTSGLAYPIVGRPNRSIDAEENITRILRMLGDASPESVLIYQTNDEKYSHIGDLSVAALKAQGCRGAVIDGGARDVSAILEMNFPVFTTHLTPEDAVPRWELLDWDCSAVVGGVDVNPGDIVVGDVDGVVVVPQHLAIDVLERAEELVQTENEVRKAVANGMKPIDAYRQFGEF